MAVKARAGGWQPDSESLTPRTAVRDCVRKGDGGSVSGTWRALPGRGHPARTWTPASSTRAVRATETGPDRLTLTRHWVVSHPQPTRAPREDGHRVVTR